MVDHQHFHPNNVSLNLSVILRFQLTAERVAGMVESQPSSNGRGYLKIQITNKQINKQPNKQINKQTSKQANKQTNKQANKHTNKQINK